MVSVLWGWGGCRRGIAPFSILLSRRYVNRALWTVALFIRYGPVLRNAAGCGFFAWSILGVGVGVRESV